MNLLNGDCLDIMKEIPDGSVDLVLCDPPYGTTECGWDSVLPFGPLWKEYRRVLRPYGVAALFGVQPFTTELIASNRADFRYCWYWFKNAATGHAYARYQPMRKVEDIAVFICNTPGHNNQGKHLALREYMLAELRASGKTRADINRALGSYMSSHYFTMGRQFQIPSETAWSQLQEATGRFNRPYADILAEYRGETGGPKKGNPGKLQSTYNPQGLREIPESERRVEVNRRQKSDSIYRPDTLAKAYTPCFTNWPKNVLQFNTERGYHPTQKPVPLLEYLVKTYTNEGDTVLDNCMGSGSTGVACVRSGRHFIGIEKDPGYFETAKKRIEEVMQ